MAESPVVDEKGILARCRKLEEAHGNLWRSYHEAMTEEERFLAGDRYEDDTRDYNRDRRFIQIRGQELQDTIRHIAAKVTERPRSLEARPRDMVDDPDAGETATALIEWELGDLWKGFEDVYEEAIISAREKRLGAVMMDWDPDLGPFGEILFRYADPQNLSWDPAYWPHHPKCGWLREQKRVDVDLARTLYKADWLMPDRAQWRDGTVKPGVPLIRGLTDNPEFARSLDDNKVTLWFWWWKNDPTSKPADMPLDRRDLDPADRYMRCPQCGYRSPTQSEMAESGTFKGTLPQNSPCPVCMDNGTPSEMTRIDSLAESAQVLSFARGHRLTIHAPYSANPKGDLPVQDGNWPIPTARSFPAFLITAYSKPGRPLGPSDTTLMWDQQIAADNLRTLGIQRIYEHRTIWKQSRKGWYDAQGRRYEHRDDQYNVAFGDQTDTEFGPLFMDPINASGLDPEFSQVMQVTLNALTQYRGITDLGLTQESSKDIAASSLAQMNQMGEVPTAHFDRRKHRELSKFIAVLWDYIRATYTPLRLARLRLDGVDVHARLHGDDLPNYDFQVSDTPPWSGLEKARADAFQPLLNLATTQPDMVEVWCELNNIPRSVMRKVQRIIAQRSEQPPAPAGAGSPQGLAATGGPALQGGATPPAPGPEPQEPEPGQTIEVPEAPLVSGVR